MKHETMDNVVRDSAGDAWDCQWEKLEGYPIPRSTRVRLRKLGSTGQFTHYYDAHYPADIFKPEFIAGDFTAIPL